MDKTSKKVIVKKPDLNSKAGKYFLAKRRGLTKMAAARQAGYSPSNNITNIEASKTYQAIEKVYYKDELLKQITLQQIAEEQIKNITQDKDRGAKNKAIEMALNRIEPETNPSTDDDRMVVIFKTSAL